MCFSNPNIKNLHQWNWDGDIIIHESIVPASRWVVGYNSKHEYNIDIREFLINERNEIIRKTLKVDIKAFVEKIKGNYEFFTSRSSKSFDYRVDIITAWVSENIKYKHRDGKDPWQFPDETLFVGEGDCEDRAFLIASLLLGSGISNFNVRVVLGKVHTEDGHGNKEKYDHVWVMYKAESGHWIVIEPLHLRENTVNTKKEREKSNDDSKKQLIAEYKPHFLFNDQHLWAVPGHQKNNDFTNLVKLRSKWKKWNPKFAGAVHKTIIQQALISLPEEQHWVIDALNRKFSRAILGIAGPIVDAIDRDIKSYSPIDHFDNGYIAEGWQNVKEKLGAFGENNDDLDSFFSAAHAIADFYAHTSYVYFQTLGVSPEEVPLYNPDEQLTFTPHYNSGAFNLDSGKFTVNDYYWNNQPKTPAQQWDGKLISGRYAQKKDTQPGLLNVFIEGRSNIPSVLLKQEDFFTRGALPHHNEIAVDDEKFNPQTHKLYQNESDYKNQFNWRKNCAVRHVRKAFFDNWKR